MLNIGVLVSGGGTNLQAILDAMDAKKITDAQVVTVVSNNPGAYALERAAAKAIDGTVIRPGDFENRTVFTEALVAHMEQMKVDLVVLAGYLVVLEPHFIRSFRNRIINIHPSLIPAFCGTGFYGLKVHEAALERGVKLAGATVHFVDEGTDTGPIIAQKAIAVREDDTPKSLQRRVMEEAEWRLLPEAIDMMAHGRIEVTDGKVKIKEA